MKKPRIAIVSFPGNNGDTENLRAFRRNDMDAFVFRWNDSREKLVDVDGYFIGAGFTYEDRGRAGMVAGRDALFTLLHEEALRGKPVIGCCNGAQVLIESGLIPLGDGLRMSLARNAYERNGKVETPGFLNEWVWITRTCKRGRCATGNWDGVLQIPIAHGEGRFTTKDTDLLAALKENDQLAFSYCDPEGNSATSPPYCPNGSTLGIAGICNPEGNVVGLMPHPERTTNGDPYIRSIAQWIAEHPMHTSVRSDSYVDRTIVSPVLKQRAPTGMEIFIEAIIVNNEERTVEQAARRIISDMKLKQMKYVSAPTKEPGEILSHISLFNPNKEVAYIRRGSAFTLWDSTRKSEVPARSVLQGTLALLRRDEPQTPPAMLGASSEIGVCYVCSGASSSALLQQQVLNIFGNPHSSILELL